MQIKNTQNQRLGTNQKHGYYMSQQHLKLMHLMHLTGYALREYITNEIELNPALELEYENETERENNLENEEEVDLSESLFWKQEEDLFEKSTRENKVIREYYEAPVINYSTIQENLKEQIRLLNIDNEKKDIINFIIDELDDDGYLRRKTEDVTDDYSFQRKVITDESKIIDALETLQNCEPAGIGARNLKECLLLQLKKKNFDNNRSLGIIILEECMHELTSNNIESIAAKLNKNIFEINQAIETILKLSPKPIFESNKYEQLKHQIIPDFEVTLQDNDIIVSMSNSDSIKLKINEDFIKVSESSINKKNKKQTENYVNNLITDASMLVNALRDRENTMINVMKEIVKVQIDFFKSGDIKSLKPMILQDIAERTKYDISAVSRITSNKHVQTPYGIFSLKNLFMRAVSNEEIGIRASTSIQVQEIIQKIVDTEDKTKPFSDTEIMNILKLKSINIARRTIVKYREISGIPNSSGRKKNKF
jgi:RNA polymerase sigma-54 factor